MKSLKCQNGYEIIEKDNRIIIKFPKGKFDLVQESVHQAFRGVYKWNWQIEDHHEAKMTEFDEIMRTARMMAHSDDTPQEKLAEEYVKRFGGL